MSATTSMSVLSPLRLMSVIVATLACGCWPGPAVGPLINDPPCASNTQTLPSSGGDGGHTVTFQKLLNEVLIPTCAAAFCHQLDPPVAAPMTLEAPKAYASLVNARASQMPTLMRVAPGDPSKSYLIMKLRAVAAGPNSTTNMPLNQPPLDEATIQEIESWILRGAPND
jgi:hypothetical protein